MEDISDYLSYLEIDLKYSKNTIETYKRVLIKFYKFFDIIKYDLKEDDLTLFLEYLHSFKLNPKTINLHITVIKNFYKFLILEKRVSKNNYIFFSSLKTQKKLPNYLTKEEMINFLDVKSDTFINARNKCLFELMYGSGLRVSEVINLKPSDLDLYELSVRVLGKGNKEREIPISLYSSTCLNEYINKYFDHKKEYLFYSTRGNILKREDVFLIVSSRAREIGLKKQVSPHTLRHSFATHLMSGGADIRIIQEMLGHTDIRTTEIYTHVGNKEIKNAYDKFHPLD